MRMVTAQCLLQGTRLWEEAHPITTSCNCEYRRMKHQKIAAAMWHDLTH